MNWFIAANASLVRSVVGYRFVHVFYPDRDREMTIHGHPLAFLASCSRLFLAHGRNLAIRFGVKRIARLRKTLSTRQMRFSQFGGPTIQMGFF